MYIQCQVAFLTSFAGKIYSGVGDGRIVEIDQVTGSVRTVIETLGVPPCGMLVLLMNIFVLKYF